jgi:tyrosine-protein kinase Etk/Wzc
MSWIRDDEATAVSELGYAAPARDPQGDRVLPSLSLFQVLAFLLRNRRLIAGWAFAGFALAVVLTLLTHRTWTARAAFVAENEDRTAGALASLAGQFGVTVPTQNPNESPEFYRELILSRPILSAVAAEPITLGDQRGLAEILRVTPYGDAKPEDEVARVLREGVVAVVTSRQSGLVTVTARTRWPEVSTHLVRSILDEVNSFNINARQSRAKNERQFLEQRLQVARDSLDVAEAGLVSFLQNNRGVDNSPLLQMQLDELRQVVTMREGLVASLAQAYEEARLREVRDLPVISIVEPALPPVRPDRRMLLYKAALGLMFGLLLGVGAGLLRELAVVGRRAGQSDFVEAQGEWRALVHGVRTAPTRLFGRSGA